MMILEEWMMRITQRNVIPCDEVGMEYDWVVDSGGKVKNENV